MSWQAYVDDQLLRSQKVKHAVICGHDGTMWASSSGFPVTTDELKALVSKYEDVSELAANGLKVGSKKYMYLSSDPQRGIVRGRLGSSGIHCIKTKQTYIIGIYEEPIRHEHAANVVERLGEYLLGVGY